MKYFESEDSSNILINQFLYGGSLAAGDIFDIICASFIYSPDQCLFIDNHYVLNDGYIDQLGA